MDTKSSVRLGISLVGLVFGGSAFAASTWNWGATPGCDPSTCAVGGVSATVAGYGAETLTGKWVQGLGGVNGVNDVDPYGLGVNSSSSTSTTNSGYENTSSPNHSIDNFQYKNTGTGSSTAAGGGADYAELLAITFSQAVNLTQVAAAWTYTDSDAMIFRWDGTATATTPTGTNALTNTAANALPTAVNTTGSGWTLVSSGQFASNSTSNNGAVIGSLNPTQPIDPAAAKYSSYWLVSTALGQTSTSAHNDGFKVVSFTGTACAYTPTGGLCTPPPPPSGGSAPEPASLALTAVALVGMFGARRRVAGRG